jgi:hypothetical protein
MATINTRLSNIANALESCNAPNQRNRLVLIETSDDVFSIEVKNLKDVKKGDITDLKKIIFKVSQYVLKVDALNKVYTKEIIDISNLDKIKDQSEALDKRFNEKLKPLQKILFCCEISRVNMAFTDLSYNLSHSTPQLVKDNAAIKKEWNDECKKEKNNLNIYIVPYATEVLKFYDTNVELPDDHIIRTKMKMIEDLQEKFDATNLEEVFQDSNNLERFRFINSAKKEMEDLHHWFQDVKRFNGILKQLGKKPFTTPPTINQLRKINE